MTLSELSQRLSRADFVDGLGIYVGRARGGAGARPQAPLPGHGAGDADRAAAGTGPARRAPSGARPRRSPPSPATGEVDTRRTVLCVPRSRGGVQSRPAARRGAGEPGAGARVRDREPDPAAARGDLLRLLGARRTARSASRCCSMCIPREVVQGYLDALEEATVRPRGIVLASTAHRRLRHVLPRRRLGATRRARRPYPAPPRSRSSRAAAWSRASFSPPSASAMPRRLERSRRAPARRGARWRPSDVPLYRWELANGARPEPVAAGRGRPAGARARPARRRRRSSSSSTPAMLPAVGAALDAVREGDGRRQPAARGGTSRLRRGPLARDRHPRRAERAPRCSSGAAARSSRMRCCGASCRRSSRASSPQVREVKKLQADVDQLQKEIDIAQRGPGAAGHPAA